MYLVRANLCTRHVTHCSHVVKKGHEKTYPRHMDMKSSGHLCCVSARSHSRREVSALPRGPRRDEGKLATGLQCALVLDAGRCFRSFPISPLSSLQSCSRRKSANPASWPDVHTPPPFQSPASHVWLYSKTFQEL